MGLSIELFENISVSFLSIMLLPADTLNCRLCLVKAGPTGKFGFLRIHKSDLTEDQREGIFKVVDWTGWEFSKGTFVD